MHEERRRNGANLHSVYSSDEDERINYVGRSKSDKKTRRSTSFRDNTPAMSSDYRRQSLVGNKSNNSYLDRRASTPLQKGGDKDFDALYIPRTIITIAAGLAAGVFIAVISVSLLEQRENPLYLQGDYLSCSNYKEINSRTCIPDDDINTVLDVITNLQKNLSIEAGLAECYPLLHNQGNISINDVTKFLPAQNNSVEKRPLMKYVTWIIITNPSWNLRLYNTTGAEINTLVYVVDQSSIVKSSYVIKPLSCVVNQWFQCLWYGVWYILLGLLVAVIGFYSYLWYVNKKNQQQQAVFIMVDKIIEVLISHYKSSLNNKDLLPYLAISHVRDMLIPPSERVRREHIWKKAVDWIANSDSRVRVESRMIAGEQFTVWRWIQSDPPATEFHFMALAIDVINRLDPNNKMCRYLQPKNAKNPDKYEWQGKAFDAVSPPSCPPSFCMRLKNMFDSTIHMSSSDITAIQDALLRKCMDYGRVVHIVVDKRSLFGCVYMKLDSISSALAVYKALHGSWFKGRLITAKYIASEKYHKWFPAAEGAVRTIYPSDT